MNKYLFFILTLLFVSACQLFESKKDAQTAQETALNTLQDPINDTLTDQSIVEKPNTKGTTKTTTPLPTKPLTAVTPLPAKPPIAAKPTPEKASITAEPTPAKTPVAGVPTPKATPKTTPKPTSIPIISKGSKVPTSASTVQKPPVEVTAKGPGATPQSSALSGSFNNQMLTAVNALRKSGVNCGGEMMPPVKPLVWNSKLEKASVIHVIDMDKNDNFSHVGTDGSLPDDRIKAAGYEWAQVGENIGRGYKDVAAAIKGWKESANHCKQMMSADVTQMGAAQKGSYWCQAFAAPLN
jgi:uncharacterized protein YkwD